MAPLALPHETQPEAPDRRAISDAIYKIPSLMKLADVREAYYGYSGKLSDISRQLCFAGIGVVWILKIGKDVGTFKFDPQMLNALSAFCLSLMFDLLHYIIGSIVWGIYGVVKENRRDAKADDEFMAPNCINWPTLLFFWVKIACSSVGMWLLLRLIGKQF